MRLPSGPTESDPADPSPVLPTPPRPRATPPAPAEDWRRLLVLYWVTAFVEGLGMNQVFAFLPLRLEGMAMAPGEIPHFVGLFSALIFVFGLPVVPLWGVWADKYSRKAVIIRSSLIEAVVFAAVGLSQAPWQLALSLLLVGFQLGNTGVMLAALRDATPLPRVGTAIAVFGAASPIGFALGPALGGLLTDGLHAPLAAVFLLSSALSLAVAALVGLGSREVRPEVVPEGRVLELAYGAVRGVFTDPRVRWVFVIFGTAYLARQMSNPYVPILALHVPADGVGQATAIAIVTGVAALAGAAVSPLAGGLGDRIGFRPVLTGALLFGGAALATMALVPSLVALALAATAYAAFAAAIQAMVFGLLATEVPAERRSATLNLVLLPLYLAGIVGPLIGAIVVSFGEVAVFGLAGLVLWLGAAAVLRSPAQAGTRSAEAAGG